MSDEEILKMAADALGYESIKPGEYESEGSAVEAYGSELLVFARALINRSRVVESEQPTPDPSATDHIVDNDGKRWDQTMSGKLWAQAFCTLFPGHDEGLMLTWFCNAIMAGWDHRQWELDKTKPTVHTSNESSIPIMSPEIYEAIGQSFIEDLSDKELIDFLSDNDYDLRAKEVALHDDSDIGWEVIAHHMAAPHESVYGYGDTPRAAIISAMNHVKQYGFHADCIYDTEAKQYTDQLPEVL
jgi:hypothetical protein